jgi:Flp pilus assembly protein TadB
MRHRDPRHGGDQAIVITTAPQSVDDELDHRQRRYLISMAIRTACVIGAVVVHSGWLLWVMIIGAVFMPYVAVVMANAANKRSDGPALISPGSDRGMLPPP